MKTIKPELIESTSELTYKLGECIYNIEFMSGKFSRLYIFDDNRRIVNSFDSIEDIKNVSGGLDQILEIIENT